MNRWYVRNRDGRFAVLRWQQNFEVIDNLSWSRDPTMASLLDRDQLTRVLWKLTNTDNPLHDVITIEAAS